MRRQLLRAIAYAPLAAATTHVVAQANAQRPTQTSPLQSLSPEIVDPVQRVGPFPEDKHRVLLFLRFNCPHSAAYHPGLVSWGKSLPEPIRFARIPILVDPKDGAAAMAHAIVRIDSPRDLEDFEYRVFSAVQAEPDRYGDPRLYSKIMRDLRVRPQTKSERDVRERLRRSVNLFLRYGIDATPSLGLMGSAIVSPVSTGGDVGLMMQLANGLISRALEAHR